METFLMYVVSTQHIHISQPYVNIFTSLSFITLWI